MVRNALPAQGSAPGMDGRGAARGRSRSQVWSATAVLLASRRETIEDEWVAAQLTSLAYRQGSVSETQIRTESAQLLDALEHAVSSGQVDLRSEATDLHRILSQLSGDRARQGYTPTQTAVAVFSLKAALLAAADERAADDSVARAAVILEGNRLVDELGLITFEAYVRGREQVIRHQQKDLLELSVPVVQLWDGILAVPLIGTLDSGRTKVAMESLLEALVSTRSHVAILDITGVPTVDTLVAQHLLKTVAATRLMGAECIISGIRPQIAQTLVHIGVDLGEITTKATLADAFRVALQRIAAARPVAAPA